MAILAWILLLIACWGLIAHIGACLLVAARRFWPCRPGQSVPPGITLLCPLMAAGKQGAERQRQVLRAVFAQAYQRKEIIFCAAGLTAADLSAVRAARAANAAVSSLLINLPAAGGADGAAGIAAALAKGFKAARYDRVAIAPLHALLPADYLARFISREERESQSGPAALICAPLWAANPRGAKARLRAAFANGWRARRLCLADSLGVNMAESAEEAGEGQPVLAGQAALLSYEAVIRAGGIDAFIHRAQSRGAAAAAAELARAGGGQIYLTARPWALAAGQGIGGAWPAAETAWLGQYRRFLPHLFWAELLLSPFLPFLSFAAVCGLGLLPLMALLLFIAVWYGAELLCCALWGRGGSLANCAFWPARDMLLPFLWLAAAVRRPVRAETGPNGKKQPA